MNNNQDLIKWMTETRENLTFDNKIKLLKDYWNDKEIIKNLLKDYGKTDLREIEILIGQKFAENDQLKQANEILEEWKEVSKNLEKQVKSLLGKELTIAEFKEQVLILKDLFTKADLPNTFSLLLESWEELVRINHIFDNLGPDNTDSRPPSRSSFFNDDSDEETNSSESGSESDDNSDNNSDSGETKQQEEERDKLAREKAEAEKQEQEKKKKQQEEETKKAEQEKELKKWQDISPNFTEKLVQKWKDNGFSYNTAKEWINIGMNPQKDAGYCAWFRDKKNMTPEQVLNYGDGAELWNQYQEFVSEKTIEEYKTQILTILDGWKDRINEPEKGLLINVIKVLANENLPSEQQFTELRIFLDNCPSNDSKLNNLVKAWSQKNREKKPEIEIYFEPIAPAEREEIVKTTGMMTLTNYKMTVAVAERGEYRNEGSHIIGEAWNPSEGMINTYDEDDDPQPGILQGKPLKRVILQGLGSDTSKNWVEAINKSKIKKGTDRNSTKVFKVKGKIENYDENTATLTFSKEAEIEGIMEKWPL